ncbi:MAG TPA: PAS domain S-box protein [Planctomycetaceae bacterium]|nr:PAS domain S-box protein [Planctomycetaceae bacterium]
MFEFVKHFLARPSEPPDDHPSRSRAESRPDNQQQFAAMVAAVSDYAVFLLDPQGNVVTWNSGAERIKGYTAAEIIGRNFTQFYPPEKIASGWPAHELEVAAQTGRFEDEGWRLRKDGSAFWASVVITAVRDERGSLRGFLKITRDLTERKRAEETLRQSEERFRLLVEGVRDYAIFMLDPEGRVVTWNTGAERLKGYTAAEIIGQHFSRFYPQEAIDRGWPQEELRGAIESGRFEDEGWRVRKDGSQFWANVVITALRDESGTLRGFAKLTRDLTQRREAEEAERRLLQEQAARKAAEDAAEEIERQREQLHVTLNSIGDAVVVTDREGLVTFMNPVAAALIGRTQREAMGLHLDQVVKIINEDTREPVENPIHEVFRDGRIVELANHTVLIGRNGREIPVEDSAAPIRNPDGSIGGAVLVFRDVTEARRSMEARLYLAAIVESSDDAIIGHTLDGVIASWNLGAERLYGYSAAEAVGQSLSLLVPADHPEEMTGNLEQIRRGEYIDHFETVRVRKDGSRVDVSLTISPVRDSEGRIIGASKIARDITSRKEEDRRKSEFLALLAHELRNPLAPLRSGLQVLRLSSDDPESFEHVRGVMERQLDHLVRLVDDLLDVSRISRGKLQLRKERMSLSAAVNHALDLCRPLVNDRHHELTVSVQDGRSFIDVDKTRFAQAICNLISNAAKYSEPGSRIWLSAEAHGNEAAIRVKDTGIGIPPQQLPHVFDMFMQVDRSLEMSQGGLGVGLALVKRLVEMHGGSVEAHSAGPGKGSEFVIHLPLAKASGHDKPNATQAPPGRAPGGRKILVVDDNRDAALSLAMMLRLMGHEVRTAHDGVAGVETAAEFQPDIILLDIGMPRLNGYEAARKIREQPWGRNVTLVALTGWGQEEDRRRSEEAGFNSHIVKPVEPAALEKLVTEASSRQ